MHPAQLVNSARKRAREAREDLGLDSESPVPDILAAVEGAGVAVAILDLGAGLAGAYLQPHGRPVAFLNGSDSLPRQRFTLAHEFGHHRLGHGQVVDEPSAFWDYGDPDEVQANNFAAEFLMPKRGTLVWAGRHARGPLSLETVVRAGATFGVSAKAACIALQTARVLEDPKLAGRLHKEIDEGLHLALAKQLGIAYPEDGIATASELQPRLPPALRHSAFGDLLAGTCDVDELAQRIGCDVAEVEAALDFVGLTPLLAALR